MAQRHVRHMLIVRLEHQLARLVRIAAASSGQPRSMNAWITDAITAAIQRQALEDPALTAALVWDTPERARRTDAITAAIQRQALEDPALTAALVWGTPRRARRDDAPTPAPSSP
jgi:hypothetical protein